MNIFFFILLFFLSFTETFALPIHRTLLLLNAPVARGTLSRGMWEDTRRIYLEDFVGLKNSSNNFIRKHSISLLKKSREEINWMESAVKEKNLSSEVLLDGIHSTSIRNTINAFQGSWSIFSSFPKSLRVAIISLLASSATSRSTMKNCEDIAFIPKFIGNETLDHFVNSFKKHRDLYRAGSAKITNFEYDLLKHKLLWLLKKMDSENMSYFQDVFSSVEGNVLETYSKRGLQNFVELIVKKLGTKVLLDFICTPEVNGIRFKALYRDGWFREAHALDVKSDYSDISSILSSIQDVPKSIMRKDPVMVDGVLYVNKNDFAAINLERRNCGKRFWVDGRTAILSSIMNSDEPNKSLELKLKCLFNNISFCDEEENKSKNFTKYQDIYNFLNSLGFPSFKNDHIIIFRPSEGDVSFDNFYKMDFNVDGTNIKLSAVGESLLAKFECLYKSVPYFHKTRVTNIDYKITDGGTTLGSIVCSYFDNRIQSPMSRVLIMSNENQLQELDARVSDALLIAELPDGQMSFVKSYRDSHSDAKLFPKFCPRCDSKLTKVDVGDEDFAYLCSTHLSCSDHSADDIVHFVSKFGLSVPSLTKKVISLLVESGVVAMPSDLFSISKGDLISVGKLTDDLAQKVISEINVSKRTTLERFIYSLNIPSVTFLMAEELACAFGTFENFKKLKEKDLKDMNYVDKKSSIAILRFMKNQRSKIKIDRLLSSGIILSEMKKVISELCCKNIDAYIRNDYKEILKHLKDSSTHYSLSDFEFDFLTQTAEKIEKVNPDWKESRVFNVLPRNIIEWKDHYSRMKKTYSQEELKLKLEKMDPIDIVVEPKVNGIACYLDYEQGRLCRALTRHNNQGGYDITDFIRSTSITKNLSKNINISIRGELFISNKDFIKLNEDRIGSSLPPYADALGVLNGFLLKKERNIAINSVVQFFPYRFDTNSTDTMDVLKMIANHLDGRSSEEDIDISFEENDTPSVNIDAQYGIQHVFNHLGISSDIGCKFKTFTNIDTAVDYMTRVEKRRHECPANIDGMVAKIKRANEEQLIVYKFKLESRTSQVDKIRFSIGRKGVLSAVLDINPIKFSNGRQVSSVSINDLQTIKNLHYGDNVIVKYSGGTYPVLEEFVENKKNNNPQLIEIPSDCPVCGCKLFSKKQGTFACDNPRCRGDKSLSTLINFAKTLNICSSNFVEKLVEQNLVQKIADFYRLLPEDLDPNNGWNNSAISDFFFKLNASKKLPLSRLLIALNINNLAEGSAVKIESFAKDLSKLSQMSFDDLIANGIYENTAKNLLEYFELNKTDIEDLIKLFPFVPTVSTNQAFDNMDIKEEYKHFDARRTSFHRLIRSVLNEFEKEISADIKDGVFIRKISSAKNGDNEELIKKWRYLIKIEQKKKSSLLVNLHQYLGENSSHSRTDP